MLGRSRPLLRAIVSLLPLCLCHACGVGSHDTADVTATVTATTSGLAAPAVTRNAASIITVPSIVDAQVGAAFDYQPVAQDPDRDTLRFTAVNLPAWASLDPASGHITGTPGPNDAGLYESISVTVADATHKVVTAPFSITVNPAVEEVASGVASLQWELPPSKVSGEPLDDLAGYRILYGRSSSDLDHSVMIPDPAITSYQVSSLSPGVWYFAVVAVNSDGLEGPPTTLISKSI
jgi:hypothetical protein